MKLASALREFRCDATTEDIGRMSPAEFAASAYERAEGLPHAIFLSGSEHDCSRRSIALLHPAALLTVKTDRARLETGDGVVEEHADPFSLIAAAREGLLASDGAGFPPALGGYVAYEAARAIETLPSSTTDELLLPDLFFLWPTCMLVHDHMSGRTQKVTLAWRCGDVRLPALSRGSKASRATGNLDDADGGPNDTARDIHHATPLRRTFSREDYEQAVVRIRRHIYEGDVYQVNLSQRFVFPLAQNPFALWMKLFAENPAPFYAWVDAGDHQILSTSMERLFLLGTDPQNGQRIETRPIKGTRARGATPDEDALQGKALLESTKDDAELSMIVDLARNDCGRVCQAGSVRVREHKRIEKYTNVMHLVSVVEGRLQEDAGIDDVFRALFPGGSITGCPKIRAMELIDANEAVTRHVYTGSIGLMEADGRADFNIAIRTAIVRDGQCHLSVGGGIVYDSDPVEEYMETLHKGATFFQLAGINPDIA